MQKSRKEIKSKLTVDVLMFFQESVSSFEKTKKGNRTPHDGGGETAFHEKEHLLKRQRAAMDRL